MDNCYGKSDRIPREHLHSKDDRLTNKHIQTLSFLQEIDVENKQLKQRLKELEDEREKCKEIHALAEDSQSRIKEIQEQHILQADELNQMMADEHRNEMMQVLDEKMEMERNLKEEILKLRQEAESLRRAAVDLKEDSEWLEEKRKLHEQITEKDLLVEGLQIEVGEMSSNRDNLKKSVQETQAKTSELHQLQSLQAMNQSLQEELRETHQKNQEFDYRIELLQRQLKENASEKEYIKLVDALKNKLEKLLKEKESAVMKESNTYMLCEDLQAFNDSLQNKIDELGRENTKVLREYKDLSLQYAQLSRRLRQGEESAAFKDFAAVKRELDSVTEENKLLNNMQRVSSHCLPKSKEDTLPVDAKVVAKKGKKEELSPKPPTQRSLFTA